jgi:glycosyltransferase involved in cell wall biosynthesis
MKVGIISYPMLFQRRGGLQRQFNESLTGLQNLGVDIGLFDPYKDDMKDFDIIHVYSIAHGNWDVIETAKLKHCAVVVSPLLRPYWSYKFTKWVRLIDRIVGRLSGWNIKTSYSYTHRSLTCADRLLALSEMEYGLIRDSFYVPEHRIDVVPNGIPNCFFFADPNRFCDEFNIEPGFILNVATISPHKNQLTLAEACRLTKNRMVIVGPCTHENDDYKRQVLMTGDVNYAGAIFDDDDLLASAFAAASIVVLPSESEVVPLVVLESLAADTPVIITKNHCMSKITDDKTVLEVRHDDSVEMAATINRLKENMPSKGACRKRVRGLSWDAVAVKLKSIYEDVLLQ